MVFNGQLAVCFLYVCSKHADVEAEHAATGAFATAHLTRGQDYEQVNHVHDPTTTQLTRQKLSFTLCCIYGPVTSLDEPPRANFCSSSLRLCRVGQRRWPPMLLLVLIRPMHPSARSPDNAKTQSQSTSCFESCHCSTSQCSSCRLLSTASAATAAPAATATRDADDDDEYTVKKADLVRRRFYLLQAARRTWLCSAPLAAPWACHAPVCLPQRESC